MGGPITQGLPMPSSLLPFPLLHLPWVPLIISRPVPWDLFKWPWWQTWMAQSFQLGKLRKRSALIVVGSHVRRGTQLQQQEKLLLLDLSADVVSGVIDVYIAEILRLQVSERVRWNRRSGRWWDDTVNGTKQWDQAETRNAMSTMKPRWSKISRKWGLLPSLISWFQTYSISKIFRIIRGDIRSVW